MSGVAHELNNPLTAVMGYSELMQESDVEGKYQRELGTIRREALRMKQIIDNLLRFARQAKAHTKSASVQQVLQEAITLRDYDLNRSGVKVERKLQANLPAVSLDEAELKMVCVNVLSNAMDAMANASEKSVTIYAQQIGSRVVLSFEDTGAGFTDVNRAFDPFFTTKGSGQRDGAGTEYLLRDREAARRRDLRSECASQRCVRNDRAARGGEGSHQWSGVSSQESVADSGRCSAKWIKVEGSSKKEEVRTETLLSALWARKSLEHRNQREVHLDLRVVTALQWRGWRGYDPTDFFWSTSCGFLLIGSFHRTTESGGRSAECRYACWGADFDCGEHDGEEAAAV